MTDWSNSVRFFLALDLNVLCFDIPGFLSTVYMDAWHDEGGRQYFWNFLLKTLLFGKFKIRTDFLLEPFLHLVHASSKDFENGTR